MLETGQKLPHATFIEKLDGEMHNVTTEELFTGRRVVVFALPGAFTPTCDAAHMPSFVRTADAIRAKGIDDVVCISVNDAHVMRYWGDMTGATKAGIRMLADPAAEFTLGVGMAFTATATGMINRSIRYSMLVEDGVVKTLNLEEERGVCNLTAGETLLDQI